MSKGKRVATCLWPIFNIVNNPRPPYMYKSGEQLGPGQSSAGLAIPDTVGV